MTVPRIGTYYRVSRVTRETRGNSVGGQRLENLAAAADLGNPAPAEYPEKEGTSASRYSTAARPEWDQLVADVAAGELDIVILWETSRGDRKVLTWVPFVEKCRAGGVLVHITKDETTYDPRKTRDYRALIDGVLDAAGEVDLTSKRVLRGQAMARAAGRPPNRSCWGLRRVYNQDTGEWIDQVADEHTPTVRRIIAELYKGTPISRVAAALTADEIATPSGKAGWTSTMVKRIAARPAYAAMIDHKGELLPGAWEPVVPVDQWLAVRAMLRDPARGTTRPGKAVHLLSGPMVCAKCGGACRAVLVAGSVHRSYQCRHQYCAAVRQDWADEYVERLVIGWLARPGRLAALVADAGTEAAEADAEARGLKDKMDRAADRYSNDEIDDDQLARITATLRPRYDKALALSRRLAVPGVLVALFNSDGAPAMDGNLDEAARRWGLLGRAQQRAALSAIFTALRLRPSASGGRAARLDTDRIVYELR